jgi:hypothetical protein
MFYMPGPIAARQPTSLLSPARHPPEAPVTLNRTTPNSSTINCLAKYPAGRAAGGTWLREPRLTRCRASPPQHWCTAELTMQDAHGRTKFDRHSLPLHILPAAGSRNLPARCKQRGACMVGTRAEVGRSGGSCSAGSKLSVGTCTAEGSKASEYFYTI